MYYSFQHHFVAKQPRCLVSYWIDGFKKHVWLKCAANNLFITGFYRLNSPDNTSDPISLLEQVRCCSATLEFNGHHIPCTEAHWQHSLDRCVFNIYRSRHKCPHAARLELLRVGEK